MYVVNSPMHITYYCCNCTYLFHFQAIKTTRLKRDELNRQLCKEKELKYFQNYSYGGCQVECLIETLLEHCGCVGITTYGEIPQDRFCSPKKALNCYESLAYNFSSILSQCRLDRCKEACTYWRYTASLTAGSVFIPKLQEEMLKYWRLPKGDPKTSLIIADVYFSDIEYTGTHCSLQHMHVMYVHCTYICTW